jgi:molybdopterin-biosynthesis enzyme MoeA-like protein
MWTRIKDYIYTRLDSNNNNINSSNISNTSSNTRDNYSNNKNNKLLQIQNLEYQIGQLKIAMSGNQLADTLYSQNSIKSYDSWVQTIHLICNGEMDYGLSILPMIYLRAGFVLGSVEINTTKKEAEREKAFAEKFLKVNKLDESNLANILANIEKEGKLLLYLTPVEMPWKWTDSEGIDHAEKWMVTAKYMSYYRYRYKIIADPDNDEVPAQVTYISSIGATVTVPADRCVYSRYRGQPNDINRAMPLWWTCYPDVIALEKAMVDMRINNNLYAAPKPVIECDSPEAARATGDLINASAQGINYKSRSLMALVGKLVYAVPAHYPVLPDEIKERVESISRATGIPAQHLGRPDETRNKNVTQSMAEGLGASIKQDRQQAESWLTEVINKAMSLIPLDYTPYEVDVVSISLGGHTQSDWDKLVNFWLPAVGAGYVSATTFLEHIPEVDVEQELERLEEEREESEQRSMDQQSRLVDEMLSSERAEKVEVNEERKDKMGKKEERTNARSW